jgi:hypothetical protein
MSIRIDTVNTVDKKKTCGRMRNITTNKGLGMEDQEARESLSCLPNPKFRVCLPTAMCIAMCIAMICVCMYGNREKESITNEPTKAFFYSVIFHSFALSPSAKNETCIMSYNGVV